MVNNGSYMMITVPIGSMYALYGNIYHQYTPNLAYIYHTWILWVIARTIIIDHLHYSNNLVIYLLYYYCLFLYNKGNIIIAIPMIILAINNNNSTIDQHRNDGMIVKYSKGDIMVIIMIIRGIAMVTIMLPKTIMIVVLNQIVKDNDNKLMIMMITIIIRMTMIMILIFHRTGGAQIHSWSGALTCFDYARFTIKMEIQNAVARQSAETNNQTLGE